jgi:hypothetical protein
MTKSPFDHRVTSNAEHEQFAIAGEVERDWMDLLDIFLGEHVCAGCDVTDERDVPERTSLHRNARVRIPRDLDGARLGGVATKVTQSTQCVEVGVDSRR